MAPAQSIEVSMTPEGWVHTNDIVAIMTAMNFTVCFVAFCVLIAVVTVKRAIARAGERSDVRAHMERMEKMRLSNSKEITAVRNPHDDD